MYLVSNSTKSYTKSWQSSVKPSVASHTSDHLQEEMDPSSNNKCLSIGTRECLIIRRSSACSERVLLQGGGSLQQAARTTGTTACTCIKKREIVKYCSMLCEFALVQKVQDNSAMTLTTLFVSKTIKLLQVGVVTHFWVTALLSMRKLLLLSSQSSRIIDADARCKRTFILTKFKQETDHVACKGPFTPAIYKAWTNVCPTHYWAFQST